MKQRHKQQSLNLRVYTKRLNGFHAICAGAFHRLLVLPGLREFRVVGLLTILHGLRAVVARVFVWAPLSHSFVRVL